MKTTEVRKELIGKKVKGVCMSRPVTGVITDIVKDTDIYGNLCGVGVSIKLDNPIVEDYTYTEYESVARIGDEFGNLHYTHIID